MKIRKLLDKILVMNKTEQNGVIVLLVIIGLVMVFRFFVPDLFSTKESYYEIIQQKKEQIDREELMVDSLNPPTNDSTKILRNVYKRPFEKTFETKKATEYFKFDPNTVSLDDLLRLGLSQKAANVFVNYRNSGAKFYKPIDMLRVYSIDSVLFKKLEPYINIEQIAHKNDKITSVKTENIISTNTHEKSIKIIEINIADSSMWTSIPGIGPVFASRICKYRNLLGGFSAIEQLLEVYNFSEERFLSIQQYITIDTTLVKKINVNFADVNQFKSHPYINYSLARSLVDYRSKHGSFNDLSQLMTDSLMTSEEYNKLKSYFTIQ